METIAQKHGQARHCGGCGVKLKPGELNHCAPCAVGPDFLAAALAFQRANPKPKRRPQR